MGKVLKIVVGAAVLFVPGGAAFTFGALGAIGITGATAGLIATSIAFGALGAVLSGVAGLLAPSQNTGEQGQQIRMAAGPAEPREYVYGERRTGGSIVYRDTRGPDNEDLWVVSVVASHQIESFQAFHVDEKTVTLTGSAVQTSPYNGFMNIHTALGTDSQAANATMVSELSNWGSNHQGKGNAYFAVKLKFDQDIYPGGIPNISVVIRGKKVLDTRTSTTVYSANPVLCCLDYMTDNLIGPGFPLSAFDTANINAAANICDQPVTVLPSGSIKRYECHGVVNSEMSHAEVIQLFEKSMAGSITESGGKFRFHPGQWDASVLALNEDDILLISATPAPARNNLVNAVKGLFIDPAQAYQPQDYPPKTETAAENEDGGERFWLDLDLGFTTDHRMAQRIAKIAFERNRRRLTARIKTNLVGLGVKVMDVIDITHANWSWTNKTFRVREWSFDPNSATIDMVLSEEDSTVYSWVSGTEEKAYGPPATPTFFLPFGAGLGFLGGFGFLSLPFTGSNGITVPGLQAFWSTPSVWAQKIQVQYKGALEAATLYKSIPEQALIGPDKNHFPVVPGNYDVRGRYLTTYGTWSPWASQLGTNIPAGVGDATAGADWATNLTGRPQNLENLVKDPFLEGDAATIFSSQDPQHSIIADPLSVFPNILTMVASSQINVSIFDGHIPVNPGEPIYFEFSMYKTPSAPSGSEGGIRFRFTDRNKTTLQTVFAFVTASSLSTSAWTKFAGQITVPAGKYFIQPSLANEANHTAGSLRIGSPNVYRAYDKDQLVSGSVSFPWEQAQTSLLNMTLTKELYQQLPGVSIVANIPADEVVDFWFTVPGHAKTSDSDGFGIDAQLRRDGTPIHQRNRIWDQNDIAVESRGSIGHTPAWQKRIQGNGVSSTYTLWVAISDAGDGTFTMPSDHVKLDGGIMMIRKFTGV